MTKSQLSEKGSDMKIGQQVQFKKGIEGHGEIAGMDWMGYCIITQPSQPAGYRFHRECYWDHKLKRFAVAVHPDAVWPRG